MGRPVDSLHCSPRWNTNLHTGARCLLAEYLQGETNGECFVIGRMNTVSPSPQRFRSSVIRDPSGCHVSHASNLPRVG